MSTRPSKDRTAPEAMGSPDEAYQAILRLLGASRTKILDCPAGHGAFIRLLRERGHETHACDIVPEIFEIDDIECRRGDLNDSLPYENETFDVVSSCNGIHRVYAVGRAISEYARVLRPGGRLFLTLPNYASLERRLRFFFTGVVYQGAVRSGKVVEHPGAHFRQPVSISQLLTALDASGMRLGHLVGLRKSAGPLLFLPLLPIVKLGLLFTSRRKKDRDFLREAGSFPVLFGDFLLIEARKG